MRSVRIGIERVVKSIGEARSCGTCGGGGWTAIVLVAPSGKVGKPIGGCPACGRVEGWGQRYGTLSEDVETVPEWIAGV